MKYYEALAIIHQILRPTSYVEIGCQTGKSLALARCPTIAIDPKPSIDTTIIAPTRIFRQTSDVFFERNSLKALLGGRFDLALIDGMHLAEVALRDFMNLEKNASKQSVIILDDVLPADLQWATRNRLTKNWTGDVYKLIGVLRSLRPNLMIEVFDIDIKGLAIVSQLDRQNRTLWNDYDAIASKLVGEDYAVRNVELLRAAVNPRPAWALVGYLAWLVIQRSENPVTRQVNEALKLFLESYPEG